MSAGPGMNWVYFAKFFFILASTAVSTLIWPCFDGSPPAAAGAAGAEVLVPGMGAPVMRARNGWPPAGPVAPAAPAWADGSMNAAISAAAVTGRVLLSSALRILLLLRASVDWRLAPPVGCRAVPGPLAASGPA